LGGVAGFALALGLLPQAQGAQDTGPYRQLDLFSDAFERVRANYVRPVQDTELVNAAIQGMVSNLDPHSSYMDAKSYNDMQITTKGQFGGVGIEVTQEDGLIKVISPIDGTPAAKAGIKSGDRIAGIDGQSIAGQPLNEAIDKMRGPEGSKVTLTILREGYAPALFQQDLLAGLTVAIVALPLSMAIAVASGVSPERGLYTAIVGGFVVSALGGSRFQIGGPAGAFIVLVAATGAKLGLEGLLLTVLLSGLMLTLMGVLRLGSLIRHIPHAVTVGFTSGIAVTILASQLKDFGGLTLAGAEPGPFFPKLAALSQALPTLNPSALAVGLGSTVLIFVLRGRRPTGLCPTARSRRSTA